MEQVIQRLMRPRGADVARAFRRARAFWNVFLKDQRKADLTALAEAISQAQLDYEHTFGIGRSIAKGTMPFTCVACLYDTKAGWKRGRQAYARRLLEAFAASTVSLEVKAAAREATTFYGLD